MKKNVLYRNRYEIALYDEDETLVCLANTPSEICSWLGTKPKNPNNTILHHFSNGGGKIQDSKGNWFTLAFISVYD